MHFELYPTNDDRKTDSIVSDIAIASYIGTEWMPGVPDSVIDSMTAVIGNLLTTASFSGRDFWVINSELAGADRQWKGMTSWILGVAFTRHILTLEGYPWWLPVSALQSSRYNDYVVAGAWKGAPPRTNLVVDRDKASASRLLPDYVACRVSRTANTTYEFAFAESKGTTRFLDNLSKPPAIWSAQSKNAILSERAGRVFPTRKLLVASRFNSGAQSRSKRKVVTRVWNTDPDMPQYGPVTFCHFLALHYAMLCQRVGYYDLSSLMSAVATSSRNGYRDEELFQNLVRQQQLERALELLQNPEQNLIDLYLPATLAIFDLPNVFPNLLLNNDRLTSKLTRSAVQIMRAIAYDDPNIVVTNVVEILAGIQRLQARLYQDQEQRLTVTLNGVAVYATSTPSGRLG